ncbi:MAG TPA: DUF3570 domain-containing protein [Casimicrobiaceae bacterium]|nr:DUF3570 domain-containing protein [Casimicrobiaceae bacterium]
MAATDAAGAPRPQGPGASALVAAALALPGILPAAALAQAVADHGVLELKYLDYRDWQPGASRMTVRSPSLYALVPIDDTTEVEGSLVYDAMSGASPLYFNTLSGASGLGVTDYRTAGDAKVTKYFGDWALGAAGVVSSERDYLSRGGSVDLRIFSADRNRTYALSIAGANDWIRPTHPEIAPAPRNTLEYLAGITQALSPTQVVQSNVTYSYGHGYFNDPYKLLDRRPGERRILAWLTRYNQYFAERDGTLRLSYRYLHDSFGSHSDTITAAWVQPLVREWTVMPEVRYYTQSSAWFYHDPPAGSGFVAGQPYSMDTRLSAFGAFTLGLDVAKALGDGWSADLRVDVYRQQSNWRIGGGSPGILPFSARWIVVGLTRTF